MTKKYALYWYQQTFRNVRENSAKLITLYWYQQTFSVSYTEVKKLRNCEKLKITRARFIYEIFPLIYVFFPIPIMGKSTIENPHIFYSHFHRFEAFLFKINLQVKTVEMGCFAIKIIIRNHILSFKKVLKKCENWQKIFLILLTESQFSWTFFDLYPPCS